MYLSIRLGKAMFSRLRFSTYFLNGSGEVVTHKISETQVGSMP